MKLNIRNFLLLLCIVITAFVSCKKDDVQQVPGVARIKTRAVNNLMETYYYDDKGRVNKITSQDGSRTEYTYTADSIVLTAYSNTNAYLGAQTYKLNADGLAISLSSTSSKNTDTYSYTADGYLQMHIRTLPQSSGPDEVQKTVNYYGMDNNDSTKFYLLSGTTPHAFSFIYYDEYYTGKISTIEPENFGMSFLGKHDKNPVKKTHAVETTALKTAVFTYLYDSQNRIIQKTEQETINNFNYTDIYSYTYY